MRLTVTNVSYFSRVALTASAAAPVANALLARSWDGALASGQWPERLIVGMSIAIFAFAAAPRSRRSDLTMMVIAYGLCLLLMDRWTQGIWRADALMACCVGGCAVFVCSCLESLRHLARLTPAADVSQVYPARRRLPFPSVRVRIPAL